MTKRSLCGVDGRWRAFDRTHCLSMVSRRTGARLLGPIGIAAGFLAALCLYQQPRAQEVQLPPEPVVPTSYEECGELSNRFREATEAARLRVDACWRQGIGPEGMYPVGPCAQERARRQGLTVTQNFFLYPQCIPLQDQVACVDLARDDAVKRCRAKVDIFKSFHEVENQSPNPDQYNLTQRISQVLRGRANPKNTFGQQLSSAISETSIRMLLGQQRALLKQTTEFSEQVEDFDADDSNSSTANKSSSSLSSDSSSSSGDADSLDSSGYEFDSSGYEDETFEDETFDDETEDSSAAEWEALGERTEQILRATQIIQQYGDDLSTEELIEKVKEETGLDISNPYGATFGSGESLPNIGATNGTTGCQSSTGYGCDDVRVDHGSPPPACDPNGIVNVCPDQSVCEIDSFTYATVGIEELKTEPYYYCHSRPTGGTSEVTQ